MTDIPASGAAPKLSRTPYYAFGVSLLILAVGALKFGFSTGGDYDRYIDRGAMLWDFLLSGDLARLKAIDVWTILYLIPNLLFGGGEKLFGPAIAPMLVVFNIFLYAAMTALFFKAWSARARGGGERRLLIMGLALIFGLAADVLPHAYVAASDILFLFTVGATCYLLHGAVLCDSAGLWGCVFAVSLASVFIRPTGVALLGSVAAGALYVYLSSRMTRHTAIMAALVIVPAAFAFVFWPYVAYHENWHQGWLKRVYPEVVHFYYTSGMVVAERPEMYLPNPEAYFDFVRITLHRFFYYFYPLREAYSLAHNVSLAVYAVFLAWLAARGWRNLGSSTAKGAALGFLLMLISYYYGLFHSMLFVEDYRYQLPSLPPLWLLAGFGVAQARGLKDTP